MFLKYYDEESRSLRYVGHFIVAYRQCMSAYTSECLKLIGLPEGTPLRFYEVFFLSIFSILLITYFSRIPGGCTGSHPSY